MPGTFSACVCDHLSLRSLHTHVSPPFFQQGRTLLGAPGFATKGSCYPVFQREKEAGVQLFSAKTRQVATAPFISLWPAKLLMFGEDMNLGRQVHVPAFTISTVDKLSNPVFCSKRLVHFQTLLNIFKFADFITFQFVLLSVHQVKGDFILILALASNNPSVFSPQGPTEGSGVIPVKGRRMCTDPDPL